MRLVALVASTRFAPCPPVCPSSSACPRLPSSSLLPPAILLSIPSAPLLIFLHLPPLSACLFCHHPSNAISLSTAARAPFRQASVLRRLFEGPLETLVDEAGAHTLGGYGGKTLNRVRGSSKCLLGIRASLLVCGFHE